MKHSAWGRKVAGSNQLCLKSRIPRLDRVSTGSGSDLVNDRSQESLKISHANHRPGRYRSLY